LMTHWTLSHRLMVEYWAATLSADREVDVEFNKG
jgi:hypothetical protein